MRGVHILSLIIAITCVFICLGCGKIKGPQFPYIASPRVIVYTPASPASGDISVIYQLIDREVEQGSITLEYSTDGGQTYSAATLAVPDEAINLASAWHPGVTHMVTWDSVTDMVGRSGPVSVCVKITPSDASNPSGTAGVSGIFTVNNIAYNEAPVATTATPAGVQSGNVQINYFLADVESDICSIAVLYSTNDGTSWQATTMGSAGNGLTGLSSSPAGTAHVFFWDSRADNVAPSGQVDTIKIRITPTDFNAGTAGDTNSFSVDNSIVNNAPTVNITSGPADGSTVATTQVTFTWSGSDTDGSVIGYYYSFDHDPPDTWTTDISVTSGVLSEDSHIFRVVAVDDDSDLSTVASRTFTVSLGTIIADFSATPASGPAPLLVSFTDLSTSTNGITSWEWDFGNGDTSTAQHPSCSYMNAGSYTVSLTVTGPDGSDTGTKTNYVTVGGGSLGPDYIWTKRMGASNPDKATDICVDGSDNVYVVGTFCDTVNFAEDWGGTDEETSVGTWDVFVTKIDSNDSYCWTRRIGGPNSDEVHSVCTGAGGSVYITGMFEGTVDFATGWGGNDPKTSVHQDDIYITKVDASGGYAWTRTIGGQFGQNAYSICSDGTGNIYVAGNFYGTVNFAADWGGSDEKTGAGNGDIFVTKINSDGIYGWTRFMGSGTADAAHGVCADESNNIYLAGRFTGTVNFASDWSGNDTKTSVRTYDIFITRINSNGSYGWTHIMGDWGDDRALNVCSAGSGHIVQAGYFEGTTVNFAADWGGDDTKANAGSTFDGDIFITKIYAGGTYGWTHRIGGTDGDRANDICADPAGDTYVTGYFQQTVNFGEDWSGIDEKSSAGGSDIFLTKVRNNGSYAWTRRAGSTEWDHAYAVCTNSSGQIYVAGCFSGSVNFAEDWGSTDAKISAGSSDIFIMKVGPSISRSWVEKFPVNRPPSRQYPALTYDSSRGVVVLFGGDNGALLDDTWEYDGTNWVQRSTASKPPARCRHSMAYDSSRNVVVLFGGDAGGFLDDTWEYDGTNWVQKSPANKPSARRDYSVAYDSTRGVVVLFGGWGGVRLDDTWEYNGTDWVQRSTATTPYARSTHAAAYDSSRSVVVIFGGTDGSRFDDTWEYDGTDWVEVNSASRPSRRYGHSIAFDSGRAMIILFGGWDNSGRCNDTWEYNGTNWALKDPADTPPSRHHHSMVYDSSLSVTVLFGGSSSSGNLDDTWEY